MAGNRRSPPSSASPCVLARDASTAVTALPDGSLHAFALPSAKRVPFPQPPSQSPVTAVALRPPNAPHTHPQYIVASEQGDLLTEKLKLLSLPHPVSAIDYLPRIAVAASRSSIILIDPATQKSTVHSLRDHVTPPTQLCLISSDFALIASQTLTLVHIPSCDTQLQYTGHQTPVTALAAFPDSNHVVSACGTDKYINVWDATPPAHTSTLKRRRKTLCPPVATLLAPDEGITSLSVSACHERSVSIAAVINSGTVAVWRQWQNQSQTGSVPCTFVVRQSNRVSVLCAAFPSHNAMTVLLGNSLKPHTHSLTISDVEETDVIIADSVNALAETPLIQSRRKKEAAHIPASAVSVPPARRKQSSDEELDDSEHSENSSDCGEEKVFVEPSIQEKLVALGVGTDQNPMPRETAPTLRSSRLNSKVSVIAQAIRSKNSALFDECLRTAKEQQAISDTVSSLPSVLVTGDMLDMIVERLQRYPRRADILVPWVREILMTHASALISQQQNRAMNTLLSVVSVRTESLDALSRLEGRLELVVTQAERIKEMGIQKTGDAEPMAEYVEKERSIEGVESDESDGSGSDDDEDEEDTGVLSDDEEDDESDDDKEMRDAGGNGAMKHGKDGFGRTDELKMNGNKHLDGMDFESEESSDDGD